MEPRPDALERRGNLSLTCPVPRLNPADPTPWFANRENRTMETTGDYQALVGLQYRWPRGCFRTFPRIDNFVDPGYRNCKASPARPPSRKTGDQEAGAGSESLGLSEFHAMTDFAEVGRLKDSRESRKSDRKVFPRGSRIRSRRSHESENHRGRPHVR